MSDDPKPPTPPPSTPRPGSGGGNPRPGDSGSNTPPQPERTAQVSTNKAQFRAVVREVKLGQGEVVRVVDARDGAATTRDGKGKRVF